VELGLLRAETMRKLIFLIIFLPSIAFGSTFAIDHLDIYYDDYNDPCVSTFTTGSSGDLTISAAGGDISFGDEDLLTTGTLGCGPATLTAPGGSAQFILAEESTANTAEFFVQGRLFIKSSNGIIELAHSSGAGNDIDLIWDVDGEGDIGLAANNRPGNIYALTSIESQGSMRAGTTMNVGGNLDYGDMEITDFATGIRLINNDSGTEACNLSLQNTDEVFGTVFQFPAGDPVTQVNAVPGAAYDFTFFVNATNDKNKVLYIYGQPDGESKKYGAFQIIEKGVTGEEWFQIETDGEGLYLNDKVEMTGAADVVGDLTAGTIQADNGVSGTLVLDDGTTERITLVFTGGVLTSRTVAASTALLMDWTD